VISLRPAVALVAAQVMACLAATWCREMGDLDDWEPATGKAAGAPLTRLSVRQGGVFLRTEAHARYCLAVGRGLRNEQLAFHAGQTRKLAAHSNLTRIAPDAVRIGWAEVGTPATFALVVSCE